MYFDRVARDRAVGRPFDLHVPFSAALVVFIFVGFGTALPNLPGMIGPYQYACQLALGLFGVSDVEGLAYGLVLNAVQFLTLLAQGLLALPIAGVSLAEIRRGVLGGCCVRLRYPAATPHDPETAP